MDFSGNFLTICGSFGEFLECLWTFRGISRISVDLSGNFLNICEPFSFPMNRLCTVRYTDGWLVGWLVVQSVLYTGEQFDEN